MLKRSLTGTSERSVCLLKTKYIRKIIQESWGIFRQTELGSREARKAAVLGSSSLSSLYCWVLTNQISFFFSSFSVSPYHFWPEKAAGLKIIVMNNSKRTIMSLLYSLAKKIVIIRIIMLYFSRSSLIKIRGAGCETALC